MQTPAIALPFSPDEIDPAHYTLSLLGLCQQHGLLSETRQAALKSALDREFQEVAAQFTKRASSTLNRQQAEQLYDSVLFRWEAALRRAGSPEAAVLLLQTADPLRLILAGDTAMHLAMEDCRRKFRDAYTHRLLLPVENYRFAMDTAFDQFLQRYSVRFDARNIATDINYPLLHRPAYALQEDGVFWMQTYYGALALENRFCSHFAPEEIHAIVREASVVWRCPIEALECNLASLALQRMLACGLLRLPFGTLRLPANAAESLRREYANLPPHDLQEAIQKVLTHFPGDADVCAYLSDYLQPFSRALHWQLSHGDPAKFLFQAFRK